MPTPDPTALAFLQNRRSRPAKTLGLPVPDADALRPLLTAAARTPDHGKLEPWRFVVIDRTAMARLAEVAEKRGAALGLEKVGGTVSVTSEAEANRLTILDAMRH